MSTEHLCSNLEVLTISCLRARNLRLRDQRDLPAAARSRASLPRHNPLNCLPNSVVYGSDEDVDV